MHPEAKLELQAPGNGFFADEPEHCQIPIALGIRQFRNAHIISRDRKQERVSEQKVGIGYVTEKVVANAEGEIEPVKTLRCQVGEITRPHFAIIEPWLVFNFADE